MIVATVGYSSNKNNGLLTGCSMYIYKILRDNSMTYIGWPVIAITLSSQAAQEIPPLRPSSTPHPTLPHMTSFTLQLTPTHSDPSLELLYQGVVGVELKDLLLA